MSNIPALDSADGAGWFVEHAKGTARDLFHQNKELRPMGLMLARRDVTTSKLLPEPTIIAMGFDPEFMNDGNSKEALHLHLFRTARITEAFGFAFMYEGWTLRVRAAPGEKPTMPEESISQHPDRDEAVFVMVQHQANMKAEGAKDRAFLAPIRRLGGKAMREEPVVTLGDWQEMDHGEGRFMGLLETPAQIKERDQVLKKLQQFPGTKAMKLQMIEALKWKWEIERRPERAGLPWLAARIEEMDIP
jgi:hypothetical protein